MSPKITVLRSSLIADQPAKIARSIIRTSNSSGYAKDILFAMRLRPGETETETETETESEKMESLGTEILDSDIETEILESDEETEGDSQNFSSERFISNFIIISQFYFTKAISACHYLFISLPSIRKVMYSTVLVMLAMAAYISLFKTSDNFVLRGGSTLYLGMRKDINGAYNVLELEKVLSWIRSATGYESTLSASQAMEKNYASSVEGARPSKLFTSATYEPSSWWWGYFCDIINYQSYASKPPITALKVSLEPGQCWPFAGSSGSIAIVLSKPVFIKSIGYDHIEGGFTADEKVAPRMFSVFGLLRSNDTVANIPSDLVTWQQPNLIFVRLADVKFDVKGAARSQTFPIFEEVSKLNVRFDEVIFRILDNWGSEDFTCLYRLRVHGTL